MDAEDLIFASHRALKLVLWYQLLVNGMYRMFVRFYWSVWTSSALLLAGSLVMLANWDLAWSKFGPFWLWAVICFSLVGIGYLIERTMGVVPLVVVSIVLPATLIINPMPARSAGHTTVESVQEDAPEWSSNLVTRDAECFAKGALVFIVLGGVAVGTYAACRSPRWLGISRRWPPRRPVAAALIVAGLVALELLRIATRGWPAFAPPWQQPMTHYLSEGTWPYAICLWLWLEVACLLGVYDSRVLPHLLHRIGQSWAPRQLSLHDVYLVDQLLAVLSHSPSKSGTRTKFRTRKGHHS